MYIKKTKYKMKLSEGCTLKEIADELGTSEQNVTHIIKKALDKLKEHFDKKNIKLEDIL